MLKKKQAQIKLLQTISSTLTEIENFVMGESKNHNCFSTSCIKNDHSPNNVCKIGSFSVHDRICESGVEKHISMNNDRSNHREKKRRNIIIKTNHSDNYSVRV